MVQYHEQKCAAADIHHRLLGIRNIAPIFQKLSMASFRFVAVCRSVSIARLLCQHGILWPCFGIRALARGKNGEAPEHVSGSRLTFIFLYAHHQHAHLNSSTEGHILTTTAPRASAGIEMAP